MTSSPAASPFTADLYGDRQRRYDRYAGRFLAEHDDPENCNDRAEPTDDAMAATFAACGRPARPEWYPHIRAAIIRQRTEAEETRPMTTILRWEPMTLLGKPLPDHQQAVLDGPAPARVSAIQNGWGAWFATIEILDYETETYVNVSWPNAEPDHGISEDEVKAWAARFLPDLIAMFGVDRPAGEVSP